MSEIINSFDLKNTNIAIPMDRRAFYAEQIAEFKKNGAPTKAVEVVNIFLFNESGEMILQKRASTKGHNANMIDKTIGGHVVHGDAPNYTVMLKSVQELQVPSIVLNNHEDYTKTYNLLKDYLKSTSVIEYINTKITKIPKIINGEEIIIANKTHFYIGVYGGSIKNVDKEAKGVLFYSMEELKEEIETMPQTFINDLKMFIKNYEEKFKDFIENIKQK